MAKKTKEKEKEKPKPKPKVRERDRDRPEGPKPRMDAYVMMLFITFVAVVAGCVLLYLDHQDYGGKTAPQEKAPTPAKLGEAFKGEGGPAPAPKVEPGDVGGGEGKGGM